MQEICWQLQEEEMLLLRSIYCRPGEFLAYNAPCPTSASSIGSEGCIAEDSSCPIRPPSEQETVCVCIKLQMHAPCGQDSAVTVQCSLPKLYPKLESPGITISSHHLPNEYLMELNCKISSHSKALLPEPCLFDILEEIKGELVKLEPPDTPGLTEHPEKAQFTLTAGIGS